MYIHQIGLPVLKGSTAPWWRLQCVFSWKRRCWAGCGFQEQVEATLQVASQREDQIQARAPLTIQPSDLWTGFTGHMLGTRFPDQEVV